MKKILYLSYDGMTDPLGQSQVIPYLVGLSKNGYRFTIVSFEKREKFKKEGAHIQAFLDNAGIKWEPRFFSRRPPILSKLYDLWTMRRTVFQLHKREKFSFIHCRSYIAADAAVQLGKKHNVPFLFDMRGFWADERVDNGQWNLENPLHRFFYNTYKKKERIFLKKAAQIISLTAKGEEELVNKYGVPANIITIIPCCVDLNHFDFHKIKPDTVTAIKKRLGINPNEKVISYLGTLGGWYLLKEMVYFFLEMKKKVPEARFLIITQSPLAAMERAVNACGANWGDFIVTPSSREDVPVYLALSNWSIFFIKDAYSKKGSSPTKQGEIMAMGIPIVCNDVGDTRTIIESSGAGLVADGFTKQEFARIASELIQLETLNKEQIRQSAVKYFDLRKGVADYLTVYKKIAG